MTRKDDAINIKGKWEGIRTGKGNKREKMHKKKENDVKEKDEGKINKVK